MTDLFLLMWKPLVACFVLTGIHVYFGIHVLERKIVFVDLALAQIAALGSASVLVIGEDFHSPIAYWLSLGAVLLGALVISLTRTRRGKISQEALIGIIYVVAAAASLLVLSRSGEGDEELRHMLTGNILLVNLAEIVRTALLYLGVGAFHWCFRKRFILISLRPDEAFRKGVPVRLWDFLFYLTFGLVVVSSVKMAGVFLVFSFLIIPSVIASLFAHRISSRFVLGWALGTVISFAGIAVSYFADLPTGVTVVCAFGAALPLFAACAALKAR